jgi:hypothetical protein
MIEEFLIQSNELLVLVHSSFSTMDRIIDEEMLFVSMFHDGELLDKLQQPKTKYSFEIANKNISQINHTERLSQSDMSETFCE